MTAAAQHFILPAGTQVVVRVGVRGPDGRPVHPAGAVGVVIQAPADHQHAYRVRFLDHFEASFHRRELAILREFKGDTEGLPHRLDEYDLYLHPSPDSEYERLRGVLEEASAASGLPEVATAKPALNDLLLRVRREFGDGGGGR